MQVVVTGSSGPIGQALCSHLTRSGHHVIRVVRRTVQPGEFALRWDPVGNLIDTRGLEGADAVVHLAGAGVGDRRWSKDRKRVLVESRTRSTALLVGALASLNDRPRVLVSASAIGYYGDRRERCSQSRVHPVTTSSPHFACVGRPKLPAPQSPASGWCVLAPALS